MTPEEAIEMLRGMQNKKVDYAEMVCAPAFAYGYEYVYPEPEDYAIEEAIKALKEIQQYREIGTVEECREAVERLEAKPVKNRKILRNFHGNPYGIQGDCPNCGCERITSMSTDWCHVCGQHLKYDENLEGMEGGTGQV